VTKARLFSLLIIALTLSMYLGFCFRLGGVNDGGYW
jgi:hypothetical protein